jgi:cytochrome c peroxidase
MRVVLLAALLPVCNAGTPLGLPTAPGDSPLPELVNLGRSLFSDKRLSADGTVSCASCHMPDHAFTDARPTARGVRGQLLTRHTPSLLNVRYAKSLFWDGRVAGLETQAHFPLLATAEHGLPNEESVGAVARADAAYADAFKHLYGVEKGDISIREVTAAIAAYEHTLVAGDSPVDRYLYAADSTAISPAAKHGLALFRGRAQCATCHTLGPTTALLTDDQFHASALPIPTSALSRLGTLTHQVATLRQQGQSEVLNALISTDRDVAALGRFVVTLDPKDIGQFKTPSLRNVALTGPYMHDGSVATLARAIDLELYSRSVRNYPLVLSEDERADLLAFLQALSSPLMGKR